MAHELHDTQPRDVVNQLCDGGAYPQAIIHRALGAFAFDREVFPLVNGDMEKMIRRAALTPPNPADA